MSSAAGVHVWTLITNLACPLYPKFANCAVMAVSSAKWGPIPLMRSAAVISSAYLLAILLTGGVNKCSTSLRAFGQQHIAVPVAPLAPRQPLGTNTKKTG